MVDLKITGCDGLQLHVYQWLPESDIKAVVHIAHGMAEHGKRYERFAGELNKLGVAVYANDHRGHGLSIPEGALPGHMADADGWRKAVDDLNLIVEKLHEQHPDVPVILMGHSMGSFMTQDYMARYPGTVDAIALSATGGPPGTMGTLGQLVSRIEKLRNGNEGHSTLLANASFKAFNKAFAPNRTEFDWLSRDEAEVDKYVADPLCGFDCSIASWVGMLDAKVRIASDAAIAKMDKSTPLYVFAGTEDPVGENTKGIDCLLALYEKHGMQNVHHIYYDGARHEVLNETNRGEVTADFVSWLKSVVPALG